MDTSQYYQELATQICAIWHSSVYSTNDHGSPLPNILPAQRYRQEACRVATDGFGLMQTLMLLSSRQEAWCQPRFRKKLGHCRE